MCVADFPLCLSLPFLHSLFFRPRPLYVPYYDLLILMHYSCLLCPPPLKVETEQLINIVMVTVGLFFTPDIAALATQ